jgi:hypothetical protein
MQTATPTNPIVTLQGLSANGSNIVAIGLGAGYSKCVRLGTIGRRAATRAG